jgi:large subunit ribosomal protein L24
MKQEQPYLSIRIKVGDTVFINAGRNKGVIGQVKQINALKGRVTVKDVNMVTRNTKQANADKGVSIRKPAPVDLSNVQLYCAHCKKGVRHYSQRQESSKTQWDGSTKLIRVKKRFCRSCDQELVWAQEVKE